MAACAIWPHVQYGRLCIMATCTIWPHAQYVQYGRLCKMAACAIWPSVQYDRSVHMSMHRKGVFARCRSVPGDVVVACPMACLLREYRRAGTPNDRLGVCVPTVCSACPNAWLHALSTHQEGSAHTTRSAAGAQRCNRLKTAHMPPPTCAAPPRR